MKIGKLFPTRVSWPLIRLSVPSLTPSLSSHVTGLAADQRVTALVRLYSKEEIVKVTIYQKDMLIRYATTDIVTVTQTVGMPGVGIRYVWDCLRVRESVEKKQNKIF